APGAVFTDRYNRKKFYDRIVYQPPEGPPIEFVLVLKEEKDDPDSFYIMKHKVAVRDFSRYVRRHGISWKPRLGDDYPALAVRLLDAHGFATKWVIGGNLPTVQQWDKAAGRWVKGQEGPYQGMWNELRKGKRKIALRMEDERLKEEMGPMKVGEAEADVSPFGCHDMSGNGLEWTRTTTDGNLRVDRLEPLTSVKQRGRPYTFSTPLQFADLDKRFAPLGFALDDPGEEVGFRVVIEP